MPEQLTSHHEPSGIFLCHRVGRDAMRVISKLQKLKKG